MLVDFQQALADLTASPGLCNAVRENAKVLEERYVLDDRETRRLLAIANHPGMTCACTVYRMNRIAPLAMNLRRTLHALGPALGPLMSEYWRDYPHGHSHFYIEARRFCGWLRHRIKSGEAVLPTVSFLLSQESDIVQKALDSSSIPP